MGFFLDLISAVERGDELRARRAMDSGANPNSFLYRGEEQPLLIKATLNYDLPMARALLEGGADPNAAESDLGRRFVYSRRALRIACEERSEIGRRMVALLCAFGADPGGGGTYLSDQSAIIYAATHKRPEALREMVLSGYSPESPLGMRDRPAVEIVMEADPKMAEAMRSAWAEREALVINAELGQGFASGALRRPRV